MVSNDTIILSKLTMLDPVVFEHFVQLGEVVEVRIPHVFGKSPAWEGEFAKGTVCGYFDNHDAFCKAIAAADKLPHSGVYFTLQRQRSRKNQSPGIS